MEPSIDEKIFDDLIPGDVSMFDTSFDGKKSLMVAAMVENATTMVNDLMAVWVTLGLRPTHMQSRIDDAVSLVSDAMSHCVTTEKEMMEKMTRYRDVRRQQVDDMLQALHLQPFEVSDELPLLDQAKLMRDKFEGLKRVKEERMEQLHKLLQKRDTLCTRLAQPVPDLKLETNIPSEIEIMNLQTYVSDLEVARSKRFNKFMTVKKAIQELVSILDMRPETDFEKKVLLEPEHEFILSEKNEKKVVELHQTLTAKIQTNTESKEKIVDRLLYLWKQLDLTEEGNLILQNYSGISDRVIAQLKENELSKYEVMRKERMAEFIEKVKHEVEEWWESCCFDEARIQQFRDTLTDLEPESEEVLNKWEENLTFLTDYYTANRKIFDLLESWRVSWEEFETIENNEKDPDRYKNRRIPSTQIMKEQQQKRQLERRIAKLESELVAICKDLESQGKPFLVYSNLLSDYVSGKRIEHEALKENEKAMKKTAKAQKTVLESKGLSRAMSRGGNVVPRTQATPTKRKAGPQSSSRDNSLVSPSKRKAAPMHATPLAPPVVPHLVRQATVVKSSSKLKTPLTGLSARGRAASQMSLLSVNEDEFQANKLQQALQQPACHPVNSTMHRSDTGSARPTPKKTTPLKEFFNPEPVNVTRRARRDLASNFGLGSKRRSKSANDLLSEIKLLTLKSPGIVSTPCSPAKRQPRLRKPDTRRPFR